MDFGNKIKQLRTLLGLTQEELANRCELTKSYISQLENNKTSPSLATLSLILEVLGTNFSDFFHEEAENKIVFNKEEQIKKSFDGYDMTWLIPTSQKLTMESVLVEILPFN
jgi:transcriptional regulator with XRE-family HTH domain